MTSITRVPWHRPMSGRDPHEEHRTSTPLELLFDLAFVVAVAAAAAGLHHAVAEGHLVSGLTGYLTVFFAIWWVWVNYSWFASAYDTGDVIFRLTTFLVITGVLVLAAGVPRASGEEHGFGVLVLGYVIMRAAMVPLWLRVAREHPEAGATALRYATGVTVVQVVWVLRTVFLGHGALGWVLFGVLVVAELATPYWAESTGRTPWHRHHIAERYELFTIIVLGEVILASSDAISSSLQGYGLDTQLGLLILGALLLVFAMWWAYFKVPLIDSLSERTAFAFGYGHYFVLASVAAVGGCLAALVEVVEDVAHVEPRTALLSLAASVGVYLAALSTIHGLGDGRPMAAVPAMVTVVVVVAIALGGLPVGVSILLMALTVAGGLLGVTLRSRP